MEPLTVDEQVALMETIAVTPPGNVETGTVDVHVSNGKVLVQWDGVAIIPRALLEAVRRAVVEEREFQGAGEAGE